ncbi:hypothetical protein QR98_0031860 [Sarcoptes scabiei]|uniref:Uncharacterized protein n=1 Tax=Sarcoptes scabiei TaxID=52283 RepID=A0A132A0X9_SARSC|nr:hypothetical protein QR98_0031860 [Sarcoptes scabiei]
MQSVNRGAVDYDDLNDAVVVAVIGGSDVDEFDEDGCGVDVNVDGDDTGHGDNVVVVDGCDSA